GAAEAVEVADAGFYRWRPAGPTSQVDPGGPVWTDEASSERSEQRNEEGRQDLPDGVDRPAGGGPKRSDPGGPVWTDEASSERSEQRNEEGRQDLPAGVDGPAGGGPRRIG